MLSARRHVRGTVILDLFIYTSDRTQLLVEIDRKVHFKKRLPDCLTAAKNAQEERQEEEDEQERTRGCATRAHVDSSK